MDAPTLLKELRRELDRVNKLLAELEEYRKRMKHPIRRGRKSMGPEERAEVAIRIKEYWTQRRAEREATRGSKRE